MEIEDVIGLYQKSIKKVERLLSNNKLEKSIYWMSFISNILYESNIKFRDEKLERMIVALSSRLSCLCKDYSPTEKYVFYDSFSFDNRGLTQQYVRALIAYDVDFLYVTENTKIETTNIYKEIKAYQKAELCVVPNLSRWQKVLFIYNEIISYRPSKLLIHIKPWSIESLVAFHALPNSIIKYNINLTDHAFWAGSSIIDYNLEYRNYGATISLERRGLKGNQLLLLPYYPIIDDVAFNGFPIDIADDKIVLFFGGNLYKICGGDNFFLKIVHKILCKYPNCICICAGGGNEENLLTFIKDHNLENKLFFIGFRKDIFEVIKHCDVFLNTYPIGGGLLSQYAAINAKPIISYGDEGDEGNFIENFLNTKEKITFTDENLLYEYFDKLVSDKDYRIRKGLELNKNIPTTEKFADSFFKAITLNITPVPIEYVKIDYDVVVKRYIDIINTSDGYKIALLKYLKYRVFFYKSSLLIWFMLFVFSRGGCSQIKKYFQRRLG